MSIFSYDNAGIDRYSPVQWYLNNLATTLHSICVLRVIMPPYSPDLNPIEHVWAMIKLIFNRLYPEMWNVECKTQVQRVHVKKMIEEAVTHCWELITPDFFEKLAKSMVDPIEAVIEAEGWYTKY